MKRLVLIALAVVVAVSMAVPAMAKPEQVWKLSHVRPQDTDIDKDLHWFADKVLEATDGRIKVEIYGSNQLGDYTVVHERISVGAVEMACQPPGVAADKRIQLLNLPYLVKDWAEAREVYKTGSPLMNVASDLFAEQDIKYLAAYPVYFGGIALAKEPTDAGDPNVSQGLKVRVPPMKSFQLLGDALGYQATPIPFSEAFTAIQTGIVNGVIGSGAEGYYANFRDVISYYVPANTHFELWYLYMNKPLWDGLSDEDKEAVASVAAEFESRRMESAEKAQAANEQRLADYGITIIPVSGDSLALFAEKAKTEVWPEVMDDIGREWAEGVINSLQQ